MLPELTADLAEWLPRQRWYAGKGREVTAYQIEQDAVLARTAEAELRDTIIRVDYPSGPAERYQLLLGIRAEVPQRLEYATVGRITDGVVFDAVHDPELMGELLAAVAAGRVLDGVSCHRLEGTEIQTGLGSRLLTAEQSNSSVVYDETYILKLFRKVSAGANPDLEITRALALAGSAHVAAPLGWLETELDDGTATLGLLQPYFVSATEGWAMATTSVRDLYAETDLHADEVGGDFAGEATRLGAATAEVHRLLAETLPTRQAGAADLRGLAGRMSGRLAATSADVPQLAPFAAAVRAAYDALAELPGPINWQRIHGDYHLGQVLRTDAGWILLDFEGEPARPLPERIALDSTLRDVAGMLRSFDYAAQLLLAERGSNSALRYRAAEWTKRNCEAFCSGYAAEAAADPRDEPVLLRAYELDKAVYEVGYEARLRPAWLPIPLASIERLVEQT